MNLLNKQFTKFKEGINTFPLEIKIRNVLDEDYWLSISIIPFRSNGNIKSFQVIGVDISSKKKIEMEMKKALFNYEIIWIYKNFRRYFKI